MESREGGGLHGVDAGHFLFGELEVEDAEVFAHMGRIGRLHDRKRPGLKIPPQRRQRGGNAVGRTDFGEERVLGKQTASERTPGLHGDAARSGEGGRLLLRVARMNLELIHHGPHLGPRKERHEVMRQEVRHADRAHALRAEELVERAPDSCVLRLPHHRFAPRGGPVNREKVDRVKAELRADGFKGFAGAFVRAVGGPKLARDEEFRTVDAAFANRLAEELGVVVDLSRVEVTVAQINGRSNDGLEVIVERNLPGSECKRRHDRTVGKRDGAFDRSGQLVSPRRRLKEDGGASAASLILNTQY